MTYTDEYIKDRMKVLEGEMYAEVKTNAAHIFTLNKKIADIDAEIQQLQNVCPHNHHVLTEFSNGEVEICACCNKVLHTL